MVRVPILNVELPSELPDRMNPRNAGPLDAIVAIAISGIGAFITTVFIGIASIPAGMTLAITDLIDALRTWLAAFMQSFFLPFSAGLECFQSAGDACLAPVSAIGQSSLAVQAFGVAGFAAAVLVTGATIYIFGKGVSSFVESD